MLDERDEFVEDDDFVEDDFDDFEDGVTEESSEGTDDFDYDEDDDSETLGSYASQDDSEVDDEDESDDYQRGSAVSEMSPEMQAEYDSAFSGEERANNLLQLSTDKYTLTRKRITITDICFMEFTKKGRYRTVTGLTSTVKELGVLTPIHVMTTESDEDGSRYILIDGMRRVFAAMKNGISEIDAVIWDFKDKDFGSDISLPLGLMLNRQQRRQWSETWDLYRILELQSAITPGTLEFLLQMESGDAMKLKDVMLCEYAEVKEALLSGEKTLEAAYKMLAKLRKEEDQLARDDATGFSDTVESAEEFKGDMAGSEEGQLTDQDVIELLEMVEGLDEDDDVNSDDFSDVSTPDSSFVDQQKVGERHPLDPALRQAVLARDDFTCKCCGMRMIGVRLGLIAVHHIIPVSCKGKDTMENLVTLDVGCHIALHCMQRNGGTIMMSEEDFKSLPENERLSLKRALKLARIAIDAGKRLGRTKEQIYEDTKNSIKHPMPGAGMKENEIAYSYARAHKSQQSSSEA